MAMTVVSGFDDDGWSQLVKLEILPADRDADLCGYTLAV
jgi:hypothetical protein